MPITKHLAGRHDQKKHAGAAGNTDRILVDNAPKRYKIGYADILANHPGTVARLTDFESNSGYKPTSLEKMFIVMQQATKDAELASVIDLREFDREARSAIVQELDLTDEEGARVYPESKAREMSRAYAQTYNQLRDKIAALAATGKDSTAVTETNDTSGDEFLREKGVKTPEQASPGPAGVWTEDRYKFVESTLSADREYIKEAVDRFMQQHDGDQPFATNVPGGVTKKFSDFYSSANPLFGADRQAGVQSAELNDLKEYDGVEPFENWRDRTVEIATRSGIPRRVYADFLLGQSNKIKRKSTTEEKSMATTEDFVTAPFLEAQSSIVNKDCKSFLSYALNSTEPVYAVIKNPVFTIDVRLKYLDKFAALLKLGNLDDAASLMAKMCSQDQNLLMSALSSRLTDLPEFSVVPAALRQHSATYVLKVPELSLGNAAKVKSAYIHWLTNNRVK